PDGEGLFTIQEREAAGRGGFPLVGEYDVLEYGDDDVGLLTSFAERIRQLYERLVEQGYLSENAEDCTYRRIVQTGRSCLTTPMEIGKCHRRHGRRQSPRPNWVPRRTPGRYPG
ncbi:MAG: hypothetical protein Q7O66_23610, partial [Dehalococcoidia bacterium]|nr:hypothetical protein [Dehalococcoidia bacterium]